MSVTVNPSPSRPASPEPDVLNRWLARAYTLNWEAIAYIAIFVLALFTRFFDLGTRVMSHDESLHTRYSWNLYNDGNFQHSPLMHGPLLFHMTALMYFLFGDNDFTSRLYPAVLGVLLVMFPLLFRPWIGRFGALLASVMVLISPLLLYYNRYIRHDTPAIFFALVVVYSVMMYLNGPVEQRRRARWLYVLSVGLIGMFGSKEVAFIYIAIFGSFLTLYFGVRLLQRFRGLPGRTLMYFASLGVLVGGLGALGMYVVLSIVSSDVLATVGLSSFEGQTFVAWTALIVVGLLALLALTGLWAYRGSRLRLSVTEIAVIFLIAVIVCGGLIYAEERSRHAPGDASETAAVADPNAESAAATQAPTDLPIQIAWVIGGVIVLGVFFGYRRGLFRALDEFPEFDVLVVMGTLVLPWLTAIIIALTNAKPTDYSPEGIQRAVLSLLPLAAISMAVGLAWNWRRWLVCAAVFHVIFAFFFTTMFTNANGLATGMIGSLGYWIEQQGVRRGNQPQYYYLLIVLPFYEFLPIIGSVLAMGAGLTGFWRYRRNGQRPPEPDPLLPVDDPAPLGADPVLVDEDVEPVAQEFTFDELMVEEDEPSSDELIERQIRAERVINHRREGLLTEMPFLLFVSWWAVLNLVAYTLAGEKMPWLGTHMTVPMIFLAGWFFGRVFERVEWSRFRAYGWLYLLLLPLLFIAGFQALEPFLLGRSPFGGLGQAQQAERNEWLAIVFFCAFVVYLIYLVTRRVGANHLRRMALVSVFAGLSVLTFRSAWMASFINYDYPTEFLVYAHAAGPVKTVLNEIEDISQRMTGGPYLTFAYDNETSWPNSWYYRDFPNAIFVGANPTPDNLRNAVAVVVGEANRSKVEPIVEDRYYHFEYIRMWWPMQDYFNLTAQRIANTFDFNPENTQASEIRRGLFDIWWARDYNRYSEAVGGNWDLERWPVNDRMHLYVRKDVASQIWNLGVGDGSVETGVVEAQPNVCVANWQPRTADVIFNTTTGNPMPMNHPIDIAVSDGRVYIADEFNNRVAVYDTDGTYLMDIGGTNPESETPLLNRPNGVAIGPDGNLYVADTWNYRIAVFTPEGELLRAWGQPGQFGIEAQQEPVDAFWGPRDVVIDSEGLVYVSDTGNKRVRVYTAEGEFVRDIGSGGSQAGQLDEPSGLDISPDGRLFVADTWNRRVSVFSLDGSPLYQAAVRGWYDDQGNRPYLVVDAGQDLLYVTDPDAGRVLVYDTFGNCIGSFGQSGVELPEAAQLNVAAGAAVDEDGNFYVSDGRAGRVLRFAPYPAPAVSPELIDQSDIEATDEVTGELALELLGSSTEETTAEPLIIEITAEATPVG